MRVLVRAALMVVAAASHFGWTGHTARGQILETAAIVGPVVSSALIGKAVKDIIQDARLAGSTVLADGKNTGNTLLVRGADELNAAIDNATRSLGSQINRKFETLLEHEQVMLLALANGVKAIDRLSSKAYTAKDTIALDVRSIIGSLPLTTEVFILQRVGGLSHLRKTGDYRVQVIGSYVGTPASGYSTEISASLYGKSIENLKRNPTETHVTELIIPAALINGFYKDKEIVFVELSMNVKYTRRHSWYRFWDRPVVEDIATKMHLALYPSLFGTVEVSARHPTYAWVPISPGLHGETGPNAHCSSDCNEHYGIDSSVSIVVTGGEKVKQELGDVRIVSATCDPPDGWQGFNYIYGTEIMDDRRRAVCRYRARTQPGYFRIKINREAWTLTGDLEAKTAAELYFDKITEVKLPNGSKNVRVSGVSLAGGKFEYLLGEPEPSKQTSSG